MRGTKLRSSRINELDFLRFIAALMVVFFHFAFRGYAGEGSNQLTIMPYSYLASVAKYGFLGVNLFFMISGFVIVLSATSGNLQKFIQARILRLYPAFWVCCSLSLIIPFLFGSQIMTGELIGIYLVNLTMLNGFVDVPSVDGVYWTLFVEIKFYILVVIILSLGKVDKFELFSLGWLIIALILTRFPKFAIHSMLITDWAGYFIAGTAFFGVYQKGFNKLRIILLLGSYLLVIRNALHRVYYFQLEYHSYFSKEVIVGSITLFFIVFLLISIGKTGYFRKIEWRILGALTYPLYLLHSNIGFFIFNQLYPEYNQHVIFWGTVVFVLILSYIVHVLFERPISNKLRNRLGIK